MKKILISCCMIYFTMASLHAKPQLFTMAQVGSGMVSKQLCSGVFIQNRTEQDIWQHELNPRHFDPRLTWFKAKVDRQKGQVSTSLFGLFKSYAGYSAGKGCAVDRHGQTPYQQHQYNVDPRIFPMGDTQDINIQKQFAWFPQLKHLVDQQIEGEQNKKNGVRSIVVIHQGKLIYDQHIQGWNGMIPQNGWSMSKTVSAALIGIMREQGRLKLQDDHLRAEWQDGRSVIKVQDLLKMQSGLDFHEIYDKNNDPGQMLYTGKSLSAYAANKALAYPPGTHFNYSTGDTNLLMAYARTKSQMTDQQWLNYPQQMLFKPIGMRHVIFEQDAQGDYSGGSFVYASALDWARFGLLLAQFGTWQDEHGEIKQIISEDWVKYMIQPTALSNCHYAAGIWNTQRKCLDGLPAIYNLSGFKGQMTYVIPETKTVIVLMGFGDWNAHDFVTAVLSTMQLHAVLPLAQRPQ